ncbi:MULTISPECIES: glycerophosphodiester phosphodiesterase family protein [Cyclobacteriaceae]|jgi:glycerophosphoryl diester phosphodiesterase|uniref:glycerophosphodiester phosphodiesterase family protein n=1 Tax=Cyclobacteriaceae TaxID=563798 RepID=UPI00119D2377|nr:MULTISPECIES: glycerophosphodiester phosphodiesterase family protein [Cyclobacteriaceae]MBD3629848.1 glycerophosphodiester phosphodiesterase family protein [Cyclobacterium sp.]QYH39272.1 glycerophosphodiester phosphodiesterase family protein [Algoriphagus sp. NBT04N3]
MKTKIYGLLILLLLFSCKKEASDSQKTAVASNDLHKIVLSRVEEARDFYAWTSDRIPMVSAHRGGPYPGYPENSIEAFENTLKHTPSIIEFDVALTKDSVLVLMHDNTLDRTTTGKGKVIDHTFEEIRELFLVDKEGHQTNFRIPTFEEALAWGKGKTLFTVDIKREVPFEMVVDVIKKYNAEPYAAVITYSVEAAKKMHRLHPELMLSVTIRNEEELQRFEESGIPVDRWIAFTGTSERPKEFNELLHEKGVFTILGVLGNLDRSAIARGDQIYAEFVEKGADILATDRPIEAAEAIADLIPGNSSKLKYFR